MCFICLWTIEEVRPYCFYVILGNSLMILKQFSAILKWLSSDFQMIVGWFLVILSDSWGILEQFSNDFQMILEQFSVILGDSQMILSGSWSLNNSWMILKWFSSNSLAILILNNCQWFSNDSQKLTRTTFIEFFLLLEVKGIGS